MSTTVTKLGGNLGIGTATPEAKLDITSNTTSDQAPRTILSITGKTGSGTNWSGTDVEAGYTHTDGSADPLVTNITPTINKIYVIVYTISGFSAGRFDFVDFGGVRKNVYNGSNGTYTISLRAVNSTDPLELTPRSDFAGTVSIDSITSVEPREAIVSIRTSDGTIANEIRAGVSPSFPDNSIYIGYRAGQSASGVGSPSNTAVGRLALSSNVLGGYNTVFGYFNATICTQNSYMTLVGHNILPYFRSPSTNVYNTAIGTNIAYGTSFTGMSNTLIGNNIFSNTATTASNNIAMGLNTMYNATTASHNVSVGNQSLQNFTTGSDNVAIGSAALYSMVTGSRNIAIGRIVGRYYGAGTDALTDSDNSIFIGYNTKPSGDSQTNQIVIGYEAVGNGSNSVTLGNTSITKTILNGDVGIDTISPGAKLHAVATSATDVGVIVEGAASQSANLTEWQASDGTVVAMVEPDGSISSSGDISASGSLTIDKGIINAGSSNAIFLTVGAQQPLVVRNDDSSFRGDVLPKFDGYYDLGSDTKRWTNFYAVNGTFTSDLNVNTLHASGTVSAMGIVVSGHPLPTSAPIINISGGSSSAEQERIIFQHSNGLDGCRISTMGSHSQSMIIDVGYKDYSSYDFFKIRANAQDGTPDDRFSINRHGNIQIGEDFDSNYNDSQVILSTTSASKSVLHVKGAASQSANLTEWQDNASTVLASVGPEGTISTASGEIHVYNSGYAIGAADYQRLAIRWDDDLVNIFTEEAGAGSSAKLRVGRSDYHFFTGDSTIGYNAVIANNGMKMLWGNSSTFSYQPISPNEDGSTTCGRISKRWATTFTRDLDVSGVLYASGDPGTAGQSLYSNANGIEWRDSPVSEPVTNASGVTNMMVINSGDYEGITPDANTLYFIVDP